MRRSFWLYALVVATLWVGCSEEEPAAVPTTEGVWANVLEPGCGTADCHRRPQPQQGLDFISVESTLQTAVDVVPSVGNAGEVYPAIVVPGDPDASFLIAKVTTPGVDMGVAMPPTDEQLTEEAIQLLRDWIEGMEERR